MSPAEGAVTCACCHAARPAGEMYEPVPRSGTYRCRDTSACQRRMTYEGTGMEPPSFDPPAEVAATGGSIRCDFCKTPRPVSELYRPVPSGVLHRCRDTEGCRERANEMLFSTAHRDDFPSVAITTSSGLRHAERAAGAPTMAAAVPDDVSEARQAQAQADHSYALAAATRGR